MLDTFASVDRTFGGAYARHALIAYLAHDVVPRLRPPTTRAPSDGLLGLTADLTRLAAFGAFDNHAHGLAQRYYLIAVGLASRAGDVDRYTLALHGLSHQAHYLGHHDAALSLTHRALDAVRPLSDGSPRTRRIGTLLHSHAAYGHAELGQLSAAEAHHDEVTSRLAVAPDTDDDLSVGHHSAEFHYNYAQVCLHARDLDEAATQLRSAVRSFPPTHRRSRTLSLVALTALHLRTGDVRQARQSWQDMLCHRRHVHSVRIDRAVRELGIRMRSANLVGRSSRRTPPPSSDSR